MPDVATRPRAEFIGTSGPGRTPGPSFVGDTFHVEQVHHSGCRGRPTLDQLLLPDSSLSIQLICTYSPSALPHRWRQLRNRLTARVRSRSEAARDQVPWWRRSGTEVGADPDSVATTARPGASRCSVSLYVSRRRFRIRLAGPRKSGARAGSRHATNASWPFHVKPAEADLPAQREGAASTTSRRWFTRAASARELNTVAYLRRIMLSLVPDGSVLVGYRPSSHGSKVPRLRSSARRLALWHISRRRPCRTSAFRHGRTRPVPTCTRRRDCGRPCREHDLVLDILGCLSRQRPFHVKHPHHPHWRVCLPGVPQLLKPGTFHVKHLPRFARSHPSRSTDTAPIPGADHQSRPWHTSVTFGTGGFHVKHNLRGSHPRATTLRSLGPRCSP
ncbi:hypothetical protein SAMN04488554_2828 [Ruania alba]|uniref:Uncharacterized protein n=1 Tax=Ruania alba TaxID=648782 RepID=A0A1H5LI91_9MICO|nr:hypothetical protein SAMN04488554_2828 [Ruania alba]